jgi:sterol desaturase/sphingolipid hydroxylase (fatty acid hydroxylase superfamily)
MKQDDTIQLMLTLVLSGTIALAAAVVATWDSAVGLLVDTCGTHLSAWIHASRCGSGAEKLRMYAIALTGLPIILILEKLQPAVPGQASFSNGLFVDVAWFLLFPASLLLLVTPIDSALHMLAGGSFVTNISESWLNWAMPAKFVLAVLLADFLAWFNHWVRHKVPIFWEFHKIHHSQIEMNYFTSFRIHPFDTVAISLISFIPFTILGLRVALPAFLGWQLFLRVYEMFVHSNIKTTLGPMRYLLVTPQSHRVHHSREPNHVDRNFGNLLAIWDFLFRTQVRDFNAYPATGVSDGACPDGRPAAASGVPRELLREICYPVRRLFKVPALR